MNYLKQYKSVPVSDSVVIVSGSAEIIPGSAITAASSSSSLERSSRTFSTRVWPFVLLQFISYSISSDLVAMRKHGS